MNLATSHNPIYWFVRTFVLIALGGALFVGPLTMFTRGMLSGPLLCPNLCPDCHGPVRSLWWTFQGSWDSRKGSMGMTLLCHNPKVDVDRLSWSEVIEHLDALQPYILNTIEACAVDGAILVGILATLGGLVVALGKHGSLTRKEAALRDAIDALRAGRGG